MPNLSRYCRLCYENKDISRFSWRKDSNNYRTECKDCLNKKRKESSSYGKWHKNNRNKVRKYMKNYDLKRHYGISIEEFQEMKKLQNNLCYICNIPSEKELHVDHCHKTGGIRRLLCEHCNRGLGCFRDNTQLLKNAIEYLNANRN